MPRAKSSSSKFGARKKYSLARAACTAAVTPGAPSTLGAQVNATIVDAAVAAGKRKVKNL